MISIADPDVGAEEEDRVVEVLESGQLVAGEEVREFEREFAGYCGADHAVATANGTAAIHAALTALGLGEGDTVITSPFSFVATANAIRHCGAEPAFADVDPDTYNLDPAAVEAVAREIDADAILAVHLFGLPADVERLQRVADEHDLLLVEDAAQAHGARYRGDRVGTFGDAACFSFYPTKNMTTGEGGMLVTDRQDVAERAQRFVNHGRTGRYDHAEVGHNFRMPEMAAAMGRVQLRKLPRYTQARRSNAAVLDEALTEEPVATPVEPADRYHVYHQYTVRCPDREGLRTYLKEQGIGTGVYYPTPIHEQPAYAEVACDAPVAERAAEEVLSLPVHPGVDREDLRQIATHVARYEP
jgi:dTDP-4-amino-4,6-dideoxygalactose transaminase